MDVSELEGAPIADVEVSPKGRLVDLMNRYEQPLCAFLLGDGDLVRDCAQDTFLRAYENLQRGKPVNGQWLYKVARNRAIDHLRHQQRVHTDLEALESIAAQEAEENQKEQTVRRALDQLPASDREVLYLFAVDKFSTSEIAAMLGIRPGAARVRLSRARER